jgi:hypothetical protein
MPSIHDEQMAAGHNNTPASAEGVDASSASAPSLH